MVGLCGCAALIAACGDGSGDDEATAGPDASVVDAGPPDASPPIDLLANGDVEQGQTSPAHWSRSVFAPPNHEFAWTTDEAASGEKSLSISAPKAVDSFVFWTQAPSFDELRTGDAVVLRGAVKTDGMTGEGVSIAVRVDDVVAEVDNDFASTQFIFDITGTSDWQYFTVSIPEVTVTPGWLSVFLVYLPNTTGTAYFDDLSLTVTR